MGCLFELIFCLRKLERVLVLRLIESEPQLLVMSGAPALAQGYAYPRLVNLSVSAPMRNSETMSENRRADGRANDELRPLSFIRGYTKYAEGSVLVSAGDTRVLCTASVTRGVPRFLEGRGEGWVTAEYGLLPRSTGTRCEREAARGKQSGRTQEIQRLIGRSLRAIVDRKRIDGWTIQIDCDVLQADGGTRCASITGAWVALRDAVNWMLREGHIAEDPILSQVSAVSVGMNEHVARLDLNYLEDSQGDTDMNVVMTGEGAFVEIQGTAEGAPFSRAELNELLALAEKGNREIMAAQRAALLEK